MAEERRSENPLERYAKYLRNTSETLCKIPLKYRRKVTRTPSPRRLKYHQFTFHLAPPPKLRDNKYNVPGMGKFVYTAAAFSNRNHLK